MSFIDDQFDNWLMQDALGFHDDEECEFDDTFIIAYFFSLFYSNPSFHVPFTV